MYFVGYSLDANATIVNDKDKRLRCWNPRRQHISIIKPQKCNEYFNSRTRSVFDTSTDDLAPFKVLSDEKKDKLLQLTADGADNDESIAYKVQSEILQIPYGYISNDGLYIPISPNRKIPQKSDRVIRKQQASNTQPPQDLDEDLILDPARKHLFKQHQLTTDKQKALVLEGEMNNLTIRIGNKPIKYITIKIAGIILIMDIL